MGSMRYKITEPATILPMPLQQAKQHLRVDYCDEDDLIAGLIAAAAKHCEQLMDRAIMDQEVTVTYDDRRTVYPLPIKNATTIDAVYNEEGEELGSGQWEFDSITDSVKPIDVYIGKVVYRAGTTDVLAVSPSQVQAMLLLIGHWYENRQAVTTEKTPQVLELAVDALLNPDRSLGL
jgi:uncharacterized phiE125 gp8 family phage protein